MSDNPAEKAPLKAPNGDGPRGTEGFDVTPQNDSGRDRDVEVLSALFSDYASRAASISDRQFTVAVSVITLNLAVVAALVSFSAVVATPGIVGASALALFNLAATGYICRKARQYWQHQDARNSLERQMRQILTSREKSAAESNKEASKPDCVLLRGSGGSLAFVIAIWIVALVAIIALCKPDLIRRHPDSNGPPATSAAEPS